MHSASGRCVIDKPTRVNLKSATAIDHIYTNNVIDEITPGIVLAYTSHHLPVFIKVKVACPDIKGKSAQCITV